MFLLFSKDIGVFFYSEDAAGAGHTAAWSLEMLKTSTTYATNATTHTYQISGSLFSPVNRPTLP